MADALQEITVFAKIVATGTDPDTGYDSFRLGGFEFRRDEAWEFPFQARLGFGNPSLSFSNTQVGLYLQDEWKPNSKLTINAGVRWDYESNMINNDFVTPANVRAALASEVPDVVLLDVHLPGEDGLTLARYLRGVKSVRPLVKDNPVLR